METELEQVRTCDLCGSGSSRYVRATRDRLHGLAGTFALVRCEGCGLVRLSPRPVGEHLGRFYPGEDYLPHRAGAFTQGGEGRRLARLRDAVRDEALRRIGYPRPAHRWLRPFTSVTHGPLMRRVSFGWSGFPPFVAGGRALDIGSGNGFFLAMLQHHGWSVEGIELSESAAATTRRAFGIEVYVGEVTDEGFEPGEFDFIHMSHVIEHVRSPIATLTRVRQLLRPGGLLYVETPNIASLGARIWGEHWFALDSPRHLWLFDPSTLRRAVEASGLSITRLRTETWKRLEWEATYRAEDRSGQRREPRPHARPAELPALGAVRTLTAAWRAARPLSGDILCCWATRPNPPAGAGSEESRSSVANGTDEANGAGEANREGLGQH